MTGNRIYGFSDADMVAFDALVACQLQTNQAVQQLARAIAAERGVELSAPQPSAPRPKRRYRLTNLIRNQDGTTDGEVEWEEVEPAPAVDRAPAPSSTRPGLSEDIFGSIDEPRP